MSQPAQTPRRYTVHARDLTGLGARLVEEDSFEAAALAFLEDFHPPGGEDADVSVIVRDLENGREHCFRVDLHSGAAEPCG